MEDGIFCFGRFRLIVRERVLTKDQVPVSLGSRAFDLLVALVERAGETVDREKLFALVWPDVIVSKVNLRVHIAGLRRALGDGLDGKRLIVSVAGRGYRFVAAVDRLAPAIRHAAAVAALGSHRSRKRFISLGSQSDWSRTSIALTLAHRLANHVDEAMCVVNCTRIDDSTQLTVALSSMLGCPTNPQRSLGCVLTYLRDKEMLLVFDNCDHVFAEVAQIAERLFVEAPLVHVLLLVSSREPPRLHPLAHSVGE